MESSPFVSVIIPVFNDVDGLKLCLAALAEQTYGQSNYEVIVVDNGSEEPELVRSVVEPAGVFTQEPQPGSYAARNKGVALAKGEIVAFTDADCIPAADWIEKGVQRLLSVPNCGLVAGNIEIFPRDAQSPTAVELFEMATAFPQEHHLNTLKYGATANLFTFASVLAQVGPFNQTLKSGGDLDWGRRVYAQGYQQIYGADVQVAHPARRSFQQMRQKSVRLAGGHYDLLSRNLYHFFYPGTLPYAIANLKLPPVVLRNLLFWFILAQDLIPPVNYVLSIFRNPKLSSLSQRLQVAWVIVFVRYTSAWAKIWLRLGQRSARA